MNSKVLRIGNFIITYMGKQFYPLDPQPEDYLLEDIAHSLSKMCRFGGHSEYFYSVAQHSVLCATKAREDGRSTLFQLWMLFHDLSEAYLGDMTRPLKEMLPEYVEIEELVQGVGWDAFEIPQPTDEDWKEIKYYDNLLLYNEIKAIKVNHPAWNSVLPDDFDHVPVYEISMAEAKSWFITTATELLEKYKKEKGVISIETA